MVGSSLSFKPFGSNSAVAQWLRESMCDLYLTALYKVDKLQGLPLKSSGIIAVTIGGRKK